MAKVPEYEHPQVSLHMDIDPNMVMEVCEWMRKYAQTSPPANDPLKRFCIGFYQLAQAAQWAAHTETAQTEYASCAIHLLGAAELMNCLVWPWLPAIFTVINRSPRISDRDALIDAAQLCQQYTYNDREVVSGGSARASRVKRSRVAQPTANLVRYCIQHIHPTKIEQSIESAMLQLINREWMK